MINGITTHLAISMNDITKQWLDAVICTEKKDGDNVTYFAYHESGSLIGHRYEGMDIKLTGYGTHRLVQIMQDALPVILIQASHHEGLL